MKVKLYQFLKYLIVSVSKAGFLKYWDFKNCIKSLDLIDIPLHHGISLISENLISIGTNKSIIFSDYIKKQLNSIIPLNFISTSFLNFYNDIIFGSLDDNNLSVLREYELLNKKSFEFNCIAEGFDKSLEISYIQIIDDKTIISAN